MARSTKSESSKKLYRVPLNKIVSAHNPRNPLGPHAQAEGLTFASLWEQAISTDAAEQAAYVSAIDQYEMDGIKALAASILSNGLIQAITLREAGSGNFTLIAGSRRCLAVAYNACRGAGKADIEATLVKGNSVEMMYTGLAENGNRKDQNPMELCRAYQLQVNGGQTTADVATREGYSEQTVKNYLRLLELEPKNQKKVEAGKLTITGALKLLRNGQKDGDGSNGEPKGRKPKVRSRKAIEERLATLLGEVSESAMTAADKREVEVLRWLLGQEGE
jgi:ParB/RepB/Spo0J family partition protein